MRSVVLGATAVTASLLAPAPTDAHPLSLGVAVGFPGEGSGIPMGDSRLPPQLIGHLRLSAHRAITTGVGAPMAGVGLSLWAGLELQIRPHTSIPWLAVYATPGLRAGFVGPGYYARASNVFVGYSYIYSGPWTVAPRGTVGIAANAGRVTLIVEALAEVPLMPSPDLRFGGAIGMRMTL